MEPNLRGPDSRDPDAQYQEEPPSRDPKLSVDLNSPAIHVVYGLDGSVRHIDHLQDLTAWIGATTAEELADAYVSANIDLFAPQQQLQLIFQRPDSLAYEADAPIRLHRASSINTMGTTTVYYMQTWRGVPVWEAGLAVTVSPHGPNELRVTGAHSTLHLSSMAEGNPQGAIYAPENIEAAMQAARLDLPARLDVQKNPRLLSYRFSPADRLQGVAPGTRQPTGDPLGRQPPLPDPLPLSPVPGALTPDRHYFVTEMLFNLKTRPTPTMPVPQTGINQRAFVEVQTGAVLYLREGVAACLDQIFPLLESPANDAVAAPEPGSPPGVAAPAHVVTARGRVLTRNPLSDTGADALDPASGVGDAAIDALRADVPLRDLLPRPDPAASQPLDGRWIGITELAAPPNAEPQITAVATAAGQPAFQFNYNVRDAAANFTAVNAYYHCNSMFRLLKQLKLYDRFFPANRPPPRLTVDPLGMGGDIGAYVTGNGDWTQAESIIFGMAQEDTDGGLGAAADIRVVLHEFCHVLLWARTHRPTMGFAHSAGDSLAVILSDPCSPLTGEARYETFPWLMRENQHVEAEIGWRYHGGTRRQCSASGEGWCWGGDKDVHDPGYPEGYFQEQLLSTTLFRVYEVISSGSDDVRTNRQQAAAYLAYLIIRAISLLPEAETVPTDLVQRFANLLASADQATSRGDNPTRDAGIRTIPGGSITKVIYWSFTEQGLYQPTSGPPTAPPALVTGPGQPKVDVCIGMDDAAYPRTDRGEGAIWNRHPSEGFATEHQVPLAGQLNHVYVRVHNRGWDSATRVVVRGYYHMDAAVAEWETGGGWTPLNLAAGVVNPDTIPSNGSQIYGPFEWTPPAAANWSLLMSVSAEGDPSNIDPGVSTPCATGPTPLDRLVPFDNNIAVRTG